MKIGLFADPHYSKIEDIGGGRMPALAYDKIKEAMSEFKKAEVDMCFCLGDLTDKSPVDTKETVKENLREILELINSFGIPFYPVAGNHDYLALNGAELEAEGMRIPPYIVEAEEYNFIVLDANYRSNMVRFDEAGVQWDDSNLPPSQCELLRDFLASSPKKCIVLVHENLDPTLHYQHVIKNHEEVREIISSSGNVKMVIQGHYHGGNYLEIDGIPYLTVKCMCEGKENSYMIMDV